MGHLVGLRFAFVRKDVSTNGPETDGRAGDECCAPDDLAKLEELISALTADDVLFDVVVGRMYGECRQATATQQVPGRVALREDGEIFSRVLDQALPASVFRLR